MVVGTRLAVMVDLVQLAVGLWEEELVWEMVDRDFAIICLEVALSRQTTPRIHFEVGWSGDTLLCTIKRY